MKIRDTLLKTLSGNDETFKRLFVDNHSEIGWLKFRKSPIQIHTILWYGFISVSYFYLSYSFFSHMTRIEMYKEEQILSMKQQYERLLLNHNFAERDEMQRYIKSHAHQYGPEWNATKASMFKSNRVVMLNAVHDLGNIQDKINSIK